MYFKIATIFFCHYFFSELLCLTKELSDYRFSELNKPKKMEPEINTEEIANFVDDLHKLVQFLGSVILINYD